MVGKDADIPAGALMKLTWGAERRFPCKELLDATTSIRRCGKKEIPVQRGSGWAMRRSVGVVVGDERDPERDAWADALIDSGSADEVIVTLEVHLERIAPLVPAEITLLQEDQFLVVELKPVLSWFTPSNSTCMGTLRPAPGGTERAMLTGTEVRSVAETWSRAATSFGSPQLAGVAVPGAETGAGAPAPADPAGPIHSSSECPYREEEDNGLVFVRVCGGVFQMGASDDDKEAFADEKPAHRVR